MQNKLICILVCQLMLAEMQNQLSKMYRKIKTDNNTQQKEESHLVLCFSRSCIDRFNKW